MAFFDDLAEIMGGAENIPDNFRTMYGDYNTITAAQTTQPVTNTTAMAGPQPQVFTADVPEMNRPSPYGGGFFGLLDQRLNRNNAGASTPAAGNVTVNPGSGMYGGDVDYNPGNSAYNSINPSQYQWDKKDGAAKLSAAVQRAQFQDYMSRFAPIENYATSLVRGRNTADLGYDVARSNQSVVNAGRNMQGQQERAMGRFGLNYTGRDIAGSNEVAGGRVAAVNQARLNDEDRLLGLLGGGTGGQ